MNNHVHNQLMNVQPSNIMNVRHHVQLHDHVIVTTLNNLSTLLNSALKLQCVVRGQHSND